MQIHATLSTLTSLTLYTVRQKGCVIVCFDVPHTLFQREDGSAPPATRLDDGIFTSSEEGLAPSDNCSESTNNTITKTLEKLESISNSNDNEE